MDRVRAVCRTKDFDALLAMFHAVDKTNPGEDFELIFRCLFCGQHYDALELFIEHFGNVEAVRQLFRENRITLPNCHSYAKFAIVSAPRLLHVLARLGFDLNAPIPAATDPTTPLECAMDDDKEEAFLTLIDLGVDINALREESTPLMRAVQSDKRWAVRILLKKGANVHIEDGLGYTALDEAAWDSQLESMHWLLQHGAVVNHVSKRGSTPLSGGIELGSPGARTIRFLLANGASQNHRGGSTAVALALDLFSLGLPECDESSIGELLVDCIHARCPYLV